MMMLSLDKMPTSSWSEIAEWLKYNDKNNQIPAFEFSKGVAENYNCMFLEILHSLVTERSSKYENKLFFKYLRGDVGYDAAVLFWELCHKAHCLSKPHKNQLSTKISKRKSTPHDALDILQINPSFSFCRTWFTSVYDIFEQSKYSYNIQTLPGTGSVLGTWYLAIPKGGPSPDIAKKLCVAICNRDRAIERFESWIGIPPYTSLCGRKENNSNLDSGKERTIINFARKYLSERSENAIVRTEISNYNKISGILSFYLQRILEIEDYSQGKPPTKYIKSELSSAIKSIRKSKTKH